MLNDIDVNTLTSRVEFEAERYGMFIKNVSLDRNAGFVGFELAPRHTMTQDAQELIQDHLGLRVFPNMPAITIPRALPMNVQTLPAKWESNYTSSHIVLGAPGIVPASFSFFLKDYSEQ